jgi:uracil-DNA glycosylase
LNALLTVRRNEPNSHKKEGWEDFSGAVIRAVAAKPESVAFLLWGRKAEKIAGPIAHPHFAVVASHPSPFSVAGFRSTSPFTTANEGLVHRGRPPIDWDLPTS